jgi:ABC-type transporter Mla subunit MlaD
MNWLEVALIIFGIGAFAGSFLIKGKKEEDEEVQQVDTEMIKTAIENEMSDARERVNEVVDETLEYAVEKTERAAERISNEKIMAINEYSDTVLADINKSHQEIMFLYDMLNDKQNDIKETVKEVDRTVKEVDRTAKGVDRAVKEVDRTVASDTVDNKGFEVYSFVEQAPHFSRNEIAEVQPLPVEEIPVDVQEPVSNEINTVNAAQADEIPVDEGENENNNDQIMQLYKQGVSNMDIAKKLGLGVGEVKLVINLFKGAV